jgi:hypothetical protein
VALVPVEPNGVTKIHSLDFIFLVSYIVVCSHEYPLDISDVVRLLRRFYARRGTGGLSNGFRNQFND